MHTNKTWANLGQSLAVITLTAALVGCGGSSDGSGSGAASPPASGGAPVGGSPPPVGTPPPVTPPAGNTAAGNTAAGNTAAGNTAAGNTAAGNTATPPVGNATVLFEQPQENGIAGHLLVPTATHTAPSKRSIRISLMAAKPWRSPVVSSCRPHGMRVHKRASPPQRR